MIKRNFSRTRAALASLAMMGAMTVAGVALADEAGWPSRPVRIVVNYGPGGSSDNSIRPFTQGLSAALGQQVVIENKGGAAGAIGAETVQKAAPDGYTFLVTPNAAVTILPQVRKTPYDPFKDFVPVIKHADSISPLTVHPSLGVKTLKELEAFAKKNPGKLSFGGVGLGTSTQLTALMLNEAMGVDIVYIPYRGAGEALPDILGGTVQVFVDPSGMPHVYAKKLVLIGVFNKQRHPDFPDVPSVGEVYPGAGTSSWFGMFAPAGTPMPIVKKMNAAMAGIAQTPELQAQLVKFANRATWQSPEEFADFMKSEYARLGELIKRYKISMD
ncbi:MAG: Bug family tripartite tricarboxylate transporter substrate binding protein [Acetobacteraceae bacterium]